MKKGFTLLEVLVAVAILVGIGTMTYMTMANTIRARDFLAENDTVQKSVRVSMERLGQELRLAYLTTNTSAVNTYRTVFVAVNNDPVDQLWFASLSHKRLYKNSRECDQTEITIWGEDDPNNNNTQVILHREGARIDNEPGKGGVVLPLAYNVKSLDMRFLDTETGEWLEEWSTEGVDQSGRLPRAVKLVLKISAPDPDDESDITDHTFVTTILLEYAKAMKRSLLAKEGGN